MPMQQATAHERRAADDHHRRVDGEAAAQGAGGAAALHHRDVSQHARDSQRGHRVFAGAGENTVAALAITSMLAHITVVKGRGAACALGGCFAIDPAMMVIGGAPLVGGGLLHRHPESVAATAVALPAISLAVHRRPARALRVALLIGILLAARLRGSAGAGWPSTAAVWSNRFWLDRDG